jgi:hypothetical protein
MGFTKHRLRSTDCIFAVLVRRFRRLLVRIRISPFTVPVLLLAFWLGMMTLLTLVADRWIVFLSATPLAFAAVLTTICWLAYRRDFYA